MFPYKIVNTKENIVVPVKEYPFFKKAYKLAQSMSEDRLNDLLTGRYHVHKNPAKKNVDNTCLEAMREALNEATA